MSGRTNYGLEPDFEYGISDGDGMARSPFRKARKKSRRNRKASKHSPRRARRASRKARTSHRRGRKSTKSSRKGKRPYPHWLKKYQFKKKR